MDEKLSFSYVQIRDSARLRYLLKPNDIDFDKVFEVLDVVHSDAKKANTTESIEDLEKELVDQKERYDKAIRFRYLIAKLTFTRRMTPTLRYFIGSIGHLIRAEENAYQYLLNYLEMKKAFLANRKYVHWKCGEETNV
jgi:hypothetical protein